MKFKLFLILLLPQIILFSAATFADSSGTSAVPLPTPGMVTMVALGTEECEPCAAMLPAIEELQKEFEGQAALIFIDVKKIKAAMDHYSSREFPTQIFYDREGQEIDRHTGYLDKETLIYVFGQLGIFRKGAQ